MKINMIVCRRRKGSSVGSVSEESPRLEELKQQREIAVAAKENEKKRKAKKKQVPWHVCKQSWKLRKVKGKGKSKAKGLTKYYHKFHI
ncbi:peptidylprolyl isomerase [Trifolium repens]|nr:peptidylprolyl isomerase [Trifolium repens]